MYEPRLTIISDALGPRVEIVFTNLPASTATATIYRVSDGQRLEVRGAVRTRITGGNLSKVDYEVPFDVASTYVAELYASTGVLVNTTGGTTITAPSEDPDYVRVHNPLDPRTSLLLQFEERALATSTRKFGGSVLQPLGRRGGVVATTGREGLSGLNLNLITASVEESQAFDRMFENQLPVLCFRLPKSHRTFRMPPVFFAAILSTTSQQWIDVESAVWELEGSEVSPPVPALVLSLLRRRDIAAYYGTRRQKAAANSSRFQVSRRYELAGVAG